MKGNVYAHEWQKHMYLHVCIKLIHLLILQFLLSNYYVSGTVLTLGTQDKQES